MKRTTTFTVETEEDIFPLAIRRWLASKGATYKSASESLGLAANSMAQWVAGRCQPRGAVLIKLLRENPTLAADLLSTLKVGDTVEVTEETVAPTEPKAPKATKKAKKA